MQTHNKSNGYAAVAMMVFMTVCGAVLFGGIPSAGASDWPCWGGSISRNMVSDEKGLPVAFWPKPVGAKTGSPPALTARVLWTAALGLKTFGNPVVSQGRILVGTSCPQIDPRFVLTADRNDHNAGRGAVMCFEEASGRLLWQLNMPRDRSNRNLYGVNHLRLGICSSPTVDGERVYVLGYGADILCLDLYGLANGNTGPFTDEEAYIQGKDTKTTKVEEIKLTDADGDIIWRFSVVENRCIHPHDVYAVSPLVYGDLLYVTTGNGVTQRHQKSDTPDAPCLIALDKKTGQLVAQDEEKIGSRVLHGHWVTPSIGMVNGTAQLLFGGGDGILYAFDPQPVPKEGGKPGVFRKLWSFDPNAGYRHLPYNQDPDAPSEILSSPVCVNNRVYITIGQDWSHRVPRRGVLACIDPTKSGDVTETGKIWLYTDIGPSVATVSVANGLVYATDVLGKVHCVDDKTGKAVWIHDAKAPVWQSSLVADGKVYVGNSRGLFFVLDAGRELKILHQTALGSLLCGSPVTANGRLYVATDSTLYAITEK